AALRGARPHGARPACPHREGTWRRCPVLPRPALRAARAGPGRRGRTRAVRRGQGAARADGQPRGAARDPQGRRPGQGPAHGRVRHDRERGVQLHPEARHVRAGDDARDQPARHRGRAPPRRRLGAPVAGDPLLLIAGNSLTYRACFALATDLPTASGQVTDAVFGFTSMLINLMRDHGHRRMAVAFDRPEPTFRHERVESYKANREAAPDILRQQVGLVREVVETLGITVLELPGYEADDIIATLATQARDAGMDVIVVTGDRDVYQLVEDPHVKVLYNRRGVSDYVLYDEAGIQERTGVPPRLYLPYAALRGDPSDNLPGVPGVGEKTAAKLVNTYGSLDG